jgi:hypothetical protein
MERMDASRVAKYVFVATGAESLLTTAEMDPAGPLSVSLTLFGLTMIHTQYKDRQQE